MSDDPQKIFGDFYFYSASREPCIVCGHTTGDCKGTNSDPDHIFGVTKTSGTVMDDQKVLVEEDVIVEKQITPFTKSKVLAARKGTYVTIACAKELGII